MCDVFERKEMWFLKIEKYKLDTAIKKSQAHQWSLRLKFYVIYL